MIGLRTHYTVGFGASCGQPGKASTTPSLRDVTCKFCIAILCETDLLPSASGYYIQDARATSDTILWWCPDFRGYTHNVDEAGVYSTEAARRLQRERHTDRAWPVDAVRQSTERRVSRHTLTEAVRTPYDQAPQTLCYQIRRFDGAMYLRRDGRTLESCWGRAGRVLTRDGVESLLRTGLPGVEPVDVDVISLSLTEVMVTAGDKFLEVP